MARLLFWTIVLPGHSVPLCHLRHNVCRNLAKTELPEAVRISGFAVDRQQGQCRLAPAACVRISGSPVPTLGPAALGCESTPVVLTIQRRVHPAAWPQPACAGGQMRSRLSSSWAFVFHRSGLRRGSPPTMPSADFSTVFSAVASAQLRCSEAPGRSPGVRHVTFTRIDAGFTKCTPSRRWRTSRSRARSPRMHHASYPVFVHRPAVLDWASFRPRLATTPLPFSLPSALRKPGHRTFTDEVTCHARHTRLSSAVCNGGTPLHVGCSDLGSILDEFQPESLRQNLRTRSERFGKPHRGKVSSSVEARSRRIAAGGTKQHSFGSTLPCPFDSGGEQHTTNAKTAIIR